MKREKRNKVAINSWKKYFSLIVAVIIMVFAFYPFIKELDRRSSIENSPKNIIKAVIIDEKAYNGNSPVSQSFSYKYKFEVNGKVYYGTSHNEQLLPGDTIEVEFVINNPDNNAPKGYYN